MLLKQFFKLFMWLSSLLYFYRFHGSFNSLQIFYECSSFVAKRLFSVFHDFYLFCGETTRISFYGDQGPPFFRIYVSCFSDLRSSWIPEASGAYGGLGHGQGIVQS